MGVALAHAGDRRTDATKVMGAFLHCKNAPKSPAFIQCTRLCTTCVCVLYDSHKTQRVFLYASLTGCYYKGGAVCLL